MNKHYTTISAGLLSIIVDCQQIDTKEQYSDKKQVIEQNPLEHKLEETTLVQQKAHDETKHPFEQIILRVIEKLNENKENSQQQTPAQKTAQKTSQEYITLEGTVTGKSYYEFKDGKPTAYFFRLNTEQGTKTIETPINDEFEYAVLKEVVCIGTYLQIRVEKEHATESFYTIQPDNIKLKIKKVEEQK